MDEEKAAAYYEELVLKGGGAARFKQGLGYGSKPSEARTERSVPTSMGNFVRELSPSKAELLQKEIRIDSIRDKLKKRDNVQRNSGKRSRSSSPETARLPVAEGGKKKHGKDGSRSPRTGRRKGSEERRDGNKSPGPRSRSRSGDRGSHRRSRSRSRSRDRGRRRRSRSRSSSREHRKERRRGLCESERRRSRSPRRSGRREISYLSHRRRERSRSLDRTRGNRSKSPGSRDRRTKAERGSNGAADTRDYASLIPGFGDMTPAQKVKAKMRLQLSETVIKDNAKGVTGEWERFDFDKTAPLDDDAKLDGLGDDTGAPDDTVFLKHTGSTFYASVNQAKREADIQAAHEAAMFGVPTSTEPCLMKHQTFRSDNMTTSKSEYKSADGKVSENSVLSEEVLKMQQQSSWQERARRLREERAASGQS